MPVLAVGLAHTVGHDEDPFSLVRRPNRRSRINTRRAFVARAVQIAEYVIESQADEARNVLKQDKSGLAGANDARDFRPEPSSIILTSALTRKTGRLTGESGNHKVNCAPFITCYLIQVPRPLDVRPMMRQHAVTELV